MVDATQLYTQSDCIDNELELNQYPHHILENNINYKKNKLYTKWPSEIKKNKKNAQKIFIGNGNCLSKKNKNNNKPLKIKKKSLKHFGFIVQQKKKSNLSLLPCNDKIGLFILILL